MATNTKTRLVLTVSVIALAAAAGCRGDRSASRPRQFLPDMDDSPKFKPQTQTEFFADGRAMRQPVAGTVAFGELPDPADPSREAHLRLDAGYYTGAEGKDKYLATIPPRVVVDQKLIARGRERYNIYCSACHGFDGYGKGTVGVQWQGVVASFHDPKFTDAAQVQSNDGYIFHTIRNGLPADDPKQPMRMPAYGHSINEADAWAIVAYVRVLQAQQSGAEADLTPAERDRLSKTRAAEIEKVRAARAAEAAKAATPTTPQTPGAKPPEVKP